ncbi:histidine phosphatase family protein [Acinetobacter suaedae]|uniref:Histidine phosphatase family protein n=1 Tax=Acinetobacter suaedae TaxID=2609668 RepID=A0A5P1UU34_9GAMM|nr:histidine phosphatase family protein [Acinetobacter sp. C16S1]QER40235.1 histidine phosphatase family protein [Acinetobacter sp. C16S1]
MALITLVRHGQASWGVENYDQLSIKGTEQARVLGRVFDNQAKPFDRAWRGEMERHKETAQYCLAEMHSPLMAISHSGFNEFDHEEILLNLDKNKYATKQELMHIIKNSSNPVKTMGIIFSEAMQRWQSGFYDAEYVETWKAFQQRCIQAFTEIVNDSKGKNVVVFSSGGVISVIIQSLMGLSDQATFELNWSMVNCGVTQILSDSKRHNILSMNEHQHFREYGVNLLTWH